MNIRIMVGVGLAVALAGCTTTSGGANIVSPSKPSAVETRWVGQSAGKFFASFGPPVDDEASGSEKTYTWRGGYKTITVGGKVEKAKDGKKDAVVKGGRKQYLRCEAKITVSSDYVIRSIKTTFNPDLGDGKTWCEEYLAAN